ncbi:MAG: YbjN domain-containing protein [Spirulinaceae cyanobacterium]
MSLKTQSQQINKALTLYESSQGSYDFHISSLFITKQEEEIIECRLTLQISLETYQHINSNALFNLKPEIRNSATTKFQPSPEIHLEASLKPDLLQQLAKQVANIVEAVNYLLLLSKEQTYNPLLCTESWLALSVKQQQESGEIGYRTFWSYVSPQALAQASISDSGEEISEAVVNFFQEWTESHLSAATQQTTSQMLDGITNFFTQLADTAVDKFAEVATAKSKIFEEMVDFFSQEDWQFTSVKGQTILHLACQGKNGQWDCFATAKEEQQQFVFYSLCPIKAPKKKRRQLGEFVCRANYSAVIGNFELDFNDGEIRYKTSIDVEGDSLSFSLIKQMVYANVTMMDEYLPGIIAVIEGEASLEEAIAKIET